MVLTMTDMSSDSLPQIAIAKVEVEEGVPYSAERELTPWFNHPPHLLWGHFYRAACTETLGDDWKGAGFAVCEPSEVERVERVLRDAAQSANQAFADHVDRLPDPEVTKVLEGITAASNPLDDGPYALPPGPPTRLD